MRQLAIVPLLVGLLVTPATSRAQDAAGPPKVLLFEWETLRPGTTAAHDALAAGFAALAERSGSPGHWIGLNAVSGDENQALFLGGFASFAAVQSWREAEAAAAMAPGTKAEAERLEKASAALHVSQRAVYGRLREDLGYNGPGATTMGKARFVEVTVTRVRPGRLPDLAEVAKAMNQAREKVGVPVHVAAFEVTSGAPTGTVVYVRTLASLADLDVDHGKAVRAALGEEQARKLRMAYAEIVEESTRTLFAVNPKISYPRADVVAADPAFWKPPKKGAK